MDIVVPISVLLLVKFLSDRLGLLLSNLSMALAYQNRLLFSCVCSIRASFRQTVKAGEMEKQYSTQWAEDITLQSAF
ncbi:MAG: hypothetical protein HNEKOMLI_00765 [Sodalis sp. Psp]|nr:hypothetical protein [Sodalis sp. Psp]MCR3757257.1 hypothetical protein [Sodalis sp. Ppy]